MPHAVATDLPMSGDPATYDNVPGTSSPADPAAQDFWVDSASGTGTQAITWPLEEGDWTIVVMNADGSQGVFSEVAGGVTVPGITWIVALLLTMAGVALVLAIVLLLVAFKPARGRGQIA